MTALIVTLHIIACVVLVVLVLLQAGKEGMGVIFGGSSSSLFGSSGAGGLLSKMTIGAAVLFFITSLSLTYISGKKVAPESQSVILDMPVPSSDQAPQGIPSQPLTPVPFGEPSGQPGVSESTSSPSSPQTTNEAQKP